MYPPVKQEDTLLTNENTVAWKIKAGFLSEDGRTVLNPHDRPDETVWGAEGGEFRLTLSCFLSLVGWGCEGTVRLFVRVADDRPIFLHLSLFSETGTEVQDVEYRPPARR